MNIFVTDKCPYKSAQYLDDKRVIKMILETAQMLCTTYHVHSTISSKIIPYKPTHINHPCNIWVRESKENFKWLVDHGLALCDEYEKRYNKVHKCWKIILWCDLYKDHISFSQNNITPFINCARNKELNIDFTKESNLFNAYKQYLNERWKTDKKEPTWYGDRNRQLGFIL